MPPKSPEHAYADAAFEAFKAIDDEMQNHHPCAAFAAILALAEVITRDSLPTLTAPERGLIDRARLALALSAVTIRRPIKEDNPDAPND